MHTSETNNVIKLLTPRQHIVIQHMLFTYYVIQDFFSWVQDIFYEIDALFLHLNQNMKTECHQFKYFGHQTVFATI